jgi:TolA-binding protein
MKALNPTRAGRLILAATTLLAATTVTPVLRAQAPPPAPAVNSPDGRDFDAAEALFRAASAGKGDPNKFKEAAEAFEKFLEKYKMLSPKSLDAKFRLAIARLQEGLHDDAIRHLRELIANQKIEMAAREMAQLLVAKALTMKASNLPAESEPQKVAQKKILDEGVKEYDTFITAFPRSRDMDSAQFLRATLLLQSESYDEALKGFAVVARIPTSPYNWESLMWIGKTFYIQANSLLAAKGGKEPAPEDVKKAMGLFDSAEPSLTKAYTSSGDVALMNEAVFFVGQMQLTRSQHVTNPDEAQQKTQQSGLLNASLEAFRAVRSVEEVVEAQQAKIASLEQQITLIPRGPDWMAAKNRIESLIEFEAEKRERFKTGQDQYLAARLAIARIFLFLHKTDEARTLMRHLLSQAELFAKDKDSHATVSALLGLTYAEQCAELSKKAKAPETDAAGRAAAEAALRTLTAKALETYQEFRKEFKGNPSGDNLALLVANLLVEQGDADQAEKIVAEGQEDYKDWRFTNEAMQILQAAALRKNDYKKALELCNKLLASNPKPEIEASTLFVKASVQQAQLRESGGGEALARATLETLKTLRDKYPNNPQSEDAWFMTCQILGGLDPKAAITELTAFLGKFAATGGQSPNTKTNVPTAQYLLGTTLAAVNERAKAAEAWKKVYELYPESDAAPGAYFKVFDVYNTDKDYPPALKLMEDFVTKYPKHENVYFAYSNIAEFLFSGALDKKGAGSSQSSVANVEAGAKKLLDYVDYEITNNLEKKRGDGSLLKIADRWLKELAKLPPYISLSEPQKQLWQKGVDGVTSAVERLLKDYPGSERMAEALERLVTVQNLRRKAQQADAAQVEAYFAKLMEQYGTTPLLQAKIQVALASFLYDNDAKRAFKVMSGPFKSAPPPVKVKDPDGTERIAATFTPSDYDRYLAGLFEEKQKDEMPPMIARLREEYPLGEDPAKASRNVLDAQAVALFWEAKQLQEQAKTTEAGAKFAELKTKFPKSPKTLEADYGVMLGEFEQTGQAKDDYIPRLSKVVNTQTGKSFELQAKALFFIGRIQEAKKDYDGAIETFEKIQIRYASAPQVAAAGLWKAAELAEKQAKGEPGYPVKTKQEKRAAAEARAAELKAAKAAEKPADTKPAETKDAGEKPDDPKSVPAPPTATKPASEKPGDPKKAPAQPATKPVPQNPPQK